MSVQQETRNFINFLEKNGAGTVELIDQLKLFLSQTEEIALAKYNMLKERIPFSDWMTVCSISPIAMSRLKNVDTKSFVNAGTRRSLLMAICRVTSHSTIPNKSQHILDFIIDYSHDKVSMPDDINQEIIGLLGWFIEHFEKISLENDDSIFYVATQLADSLSIDKEYHLTKTFKSCFCAARGGLSKLCWTIFKGLSRWEPSFDYSKQSVYMHTLDISTIEASLIQNFPDVEKINDYQFRDYKGHIIEIFKCEPSKRREE